jgi:hypothetical protein
MRYTCVSIIQKNTSQAYFRLPGDEVSCLSDIYLDGEVTFDVHESGEYTIIETSFGVIRGNFRKIVSNVPVILKVNRKNVTVVAIVASKDWSLLIAIIVGSVITFLLLLFVWYKYRTVPKEKLVIKPSKIKVSQNPLMNL